MKARTRGLGGLLILCFQLVAMSEVQAACGNAPDACEIDNGTYHAVLPEAARDAPILVFLHGYGSSGQNVIRLKRMIEPALARGYAVLAPNGLTGASDGAGPASWNFYPGWPGRDEAAFLSALVDDAAARFGLDHDRVLLSGFSAGGFMVSYIACDKPELFSAYAPVAGGFWRPHPKTCVGPVRLLHTHGWADAVVPLEGRLLGGGRFQQGDIFAGLEILRSANDCLDEKPSDFDQTGMFMRRIWTDCAPGFALEMALFPGGHTVPEGWTDLALDWFEQIFP